MSHPSAVAALVAVGLASPFSARAEGRELRDFCAERPGATTPPCIVDAGQLMAEVDVLDITRARQDGGGWNQTTLTLSPHLRLGLTQTVEAGLTLQPYVQQRSGGGALPASVASGFGDAAANLKISLRHPGGDGLSVAILPYVSLPLAQRRLGAGGFQGGLILPVSTPIAGFSLALAPEADLVRNPGGGAHAAWLAAVSIAHPIGPGLTGAVELIRSAGEAPDRHVRQTAAGANLAWIVPGAPDLQFDVGADVGLDRDAAAVRAYAGVAHRF